jgi:hypothetical protein
VGGHGCRRRGRDGRGRDLRREGGHELVFTKSMLGRYPQPDDVVPLLREKLAE